MEDIKAKLALLKEKLVQDPGDMSVDEKRQYLEILRTVVQEAGAMEKDLNKSVESNDHEGMVLQMRGQFTRDAKGDFLLPSAEEIQAGLVRIGRTNPSLFLMVDFTVVGIFSEKNFNYIRQSTQSPNQLFQEEEVFLKLGSIEQASYILGLSYGVAFDIYSNSPNRHKSNFQFSLPSQDTVTRAVYRTIGGLLTRLKRVNDELKQLGAVPGRGGIPVLPEHFVQTDEFDETVRALQENMRAVNDQLSRRGVSIQSGKEELHWYLVSKRKVNKRKRQAALDSLVDERIDILLKLCSYDPDEIPFSFDREFA